MLRIAICCTAVLSLASAVFADEAPASQSAPTKQPAAAAHQPATTAAGSRRSAPATARRASSSAKRTRKPAAQTQRAASWRTRQAQPTPDRYKEIQDALVAKGFLRPEQATGVWDQSSVDALKQFQMQQSIDPSGKINSLSLIALGLGPKHDTASIRNVPNLQASDQLQNR